MTRDTLTILDPRLQRTELRDQLCGPQPEEPNSPGQTEGGRGNLGRDLHSSWNGKSGSERD